MSDWKVAKLKGADTAAEWLALSALTLGNKICKDNVQSAERIMRAGTCYQLTDGDRKALVVLYRKPTTKRWKIQHVIYDPADLKELAGPIAELVAQFAAEQSSPVWFFQSSFERTRICGAIAAEIANLPSISIAETVRRGSTEWEVATK